MPRSYNKHLLLLFYNITTLKTSRIEFCINATNSENYELIAKK